MGGGNNFGAEEYNDWKKSKRLGQAEGKKKKKEVMQR